MRILVLATMLLASSSLYPSFAQDEGKAPVAAPQTVPAQANQNSPPQQDQRTGGDQPRTDNREMGRDWRMHPGECIATVMQAATATRIENDMESVEIEIGTTLTEIGTTGVTTIKTDRDAG
jgi:hypothetical protein